MADVELNSIGNGDGTNYLVRDNTKIPLAGSNALAGSIVPSTDNAYDLGDSTYGFKNIYTNKMYLKGSTIFKLVDDNYICIGGATAQANGANLVLNGKNRSTSTGEFKLEARDGTYTRQLIGKPDGTLTWNNENIAMQEDTVPRSGGAVMTGPLFSRNVTNELLEFRGGTEWYEGAGMGVFGATNPINTGYVMFKPVLSQTVHCTMILQPNGTWTWSGTAVQITSDQRYKQQITEIDDKLLDAWEDVTLCQFKYNDAVDAKKDKARLHTGYVVQQIDKACKEHDVDISAYGLYCHEEYPERTEEVEVTQDDGTTTKETKVIEPAKEHYSLRYTECLVVECAYLRRENTRLKERLSKIEKLLNI